MTSSNELVTVVIPTRNRPDLVTRAVRSALAQSYPALEVVVVIDGPDPETASQLHALSDPRLTVLELEQNHGAAEARNIGVRHGRGAWIAFLDDDDHWMPEKIEVQMAARPAGVRYPIMSCRCQVITARGTFAWPRRLATPQDEVGDYLFVRHGLFKGETFAPTTTLLAPRALLERVPIPVSAFDDWEWLILCGGVEGCALITVPEVLAVHYTENNRVTLSTCRNIDLAINWAAAMRRHLSPRAYACLLLQATGGEQAARTAGVRWRLLNTALRDGAPTPMALATFTMHSLMPVGLRRRLRQAIFSASDAA
ncbi:glycosyltransferase family 2 protein [Azospirillum thermophilum]|uniref:Glycosyl transferase family 2 n=1 Tax=Azospirillum thermophilum TaxID=2202148 RepID=A0A2S2CWN0_9PROT|nr:glycosyltransferase family 2 protein [Azospirillum thermophilum]AWK88858.1 glycosyl transferase family 2 [Azospirillum thermophilum]